VILFGVLYVYVVAFEVTDVGADATVQVLHITENFALVVGCDDTHE